MSIKINNQDIVAINKGNQVITEVYKGSDLVWQLNADPLDKSIYFADPEVGRVLHANGLIADPIKSSKRELATITSLNPGGEYNTGYFYDNTVITKFPELKYCTGLSSLYAAFYYCSNLTETPIIPNSVTDMNRAFWGTGLTEAPVIPESVTDMFSTFRRCSNLVDAPTIPNSVTDMTATFYGCSSLVNAPVIPYSITDMTYTFGDCSSLVDAPVIPNNVNNMTGTFNGCSILTEAPIIPEGVTNMDGTFYKCHSLISAPTIPNSVTDMSWAFTDCYSLDGIFVIKPVNPPIYNTTFRSVNVVAIYVPDKSVNSYKTASGWRDHSDKIYPMSSIGIDDDNGVPDYFVLATDDDFSGTGDGNFKYIGNDEYVLIPKVIKGVTITKTKYMFGEGSSIVSGVGLEAGNSVTDMSYMFYKSSTTKLNLKYFDTSNVVNMSYMFYWTKMYQMNLSSFDTSKVVNMGGMFNQCTYTAFMNLSSFDTSNVTNMSYMFNNCNWLQTLDLSSFNTINVTNMSYMFNTTFNSEGSLILDVTSFDTSNVTNMNNMFESCRLKELDLGSFDTGSISTSNMNRVFFNSKIERCYVRSGNDLRNFRYDDSFIPYKLKFIIRPIII